MRQVNAETVVLLSREKVDGHISIDLDVEKLESKSGTATYAEIKAYIKEKYGLSVSSLYIGQIKDKAGTGRFAGEEALWINGNPYWSMNYIGRVTGDHFSGDFLKESLLQVPEDKPFRGPEKYSNGDYSYHCDINGDYEWFQGRETICFKGSEIYECVFHGGLIE